VTASGRRIAILGAGILGSCLALMLARRGHAVTLFDKESGPVACASRWNEGKIHLGYLYGADPTLRTARHILPGSLRFAPLISQLLDTDLAPHTTSTDDIYLVHRNSVADPASLADTFARVDALVRAEPSARDYLADVTSARARALSPAELATLTTSGDIVVGFEVPERSVNTQWLADRLAAALHGEPRIMLRLDTTITAARPIEGVDGSWRVVGEGVDEPFDLVINALWDGRLAIDRTAGIEPAPGWSHRYRLCIFARTTRDVTTRSALVAVGPFGDVKNYNGRDFYISWYPVGLRAESGEISLPEPPPLDAMAEQRFIADVRAGVVRLMPGVEQVFEAAETLKVRGGFVFAQERGSLSDPGSSIHRRDRFGIQRAGNYISVDTGKYSTAPWLAEQVADLIGGDR
jgi:glycine/D-amino acid oxidase-like deaminating enzyme